MNQSLFNGLGEFLYIGDCDAVADLRVEFMYMWVSGIRRAESVWFNDESFGDSSEVGYHIRDVTLGDVVFCREF